MGIKKIALVLLVTVIGLLTACSTVNKVSEGGDFNQKTWGMTMKEVIEVEGQSGNNDYSLMERDGKKTITFHNVRIDDLMCEVNYTFTKSDDYHLINNGADYYEEIWEALKKDGAKAGESITLETYKEKYNEIKEARKEKYAVSEQIHFNDYVLTQGYFHFESAADEQTDSIRDGLKQKYDNKQNYLNVVYDESNHVHQWWTKRTLVQYLDNGRMVFYYPKTEALEPWIVEAEIEMN
ncbi:hypothetical protein ACX93W_15295 [Paenibacillus sp. CAU 1782]